MAPKNDVNRVTKPAGKGKGKGNAGLSSSPGPSPTAKPRGPAVDPLNLLWACYKHAGYPKFNHQTVADELGITLKAFNHRFLRLRYTFDGGKSEPKPRNTKGATESEVEASNFEDEFEA